MAPLRNKLNNTLTRIHDHIKRHRLSDDESPSTAPSKQPRTSVANVGSLSVGLDLAIHQSNLATSTLLGESSSPTKSLGIESAALLPRTLPNPSTSPIFAAPTPSPTSSTSLEYTHLTLPQEPAAKEMTTPRVGSLTNPIDLTTPNKSPEMDYLVNRIDWTASSTSEVSKASADRNTSRSAGPVGLDGATDFAIFDYESAALTGEVDDALLAQFLQENENHPEHQVQKDEEYARFLQAQLLFEGPTGDLAGPRGFYPDADHGGSTRQPNVSDIDELRSFGRKYLGARCRKCSEPFITGGADLIERTKGMLKESGVLHPCLTCKKCKTASFCPGCKMESSFPEMNMLHKVSGPAFKVIWCCDNGRLFLLWSLCCGLRLDLPLNTAEISPRSGRSLRERLRPPKLDKTASTKPTVPHKLIRGKSKVASNGTGYGGEEAYFAEGIPPPGIASTSYIPAKQSNVDMGMEIYFKAISLVLPSFTRAQQLSAFDLTPPRIIYAMLQRSTLLHKAAELLRNDSVEDISAQGPLYNAVLDFVDVMGNHTTTAPLIYQGQAVFSLEEQLIYVSLLAKNRLAGHGPDEPLTSVRGNGKERVAELSQPLTTIIAKLATQCRHFLQTATAHIEDFQTEDSQKMLVLCQRIADLAGVQKANLMQHSPTATPSTPSSAAAQTSSSVLTRSLTKSKEAERAKADLSEWYRNNCVADLLDEQVLAGSCFKQQAEAISTLPPVPGRMKKLAAQISVLRTSLPEGIFVRHCSSRLDVIKILMIGPRGTPYENGLFEFDMWCPAAFPNVPPKMTFKTTGGGRVRFNPNLYEDGKVCLSLLGTWAGEPWNPGQSTLLQVLVSIQAMIFTEEPWYNEPGREMYANKPESELYNAQIQQHTVQYAMISWLNDRLVSGASPTAMPSYPTTSISNSTGVTASIPGHAAILPPSALGQPLRPFLSVPPVQPTVDDYVWGDIIRRHFAANAQGILDTLKRWKPPPVKGRASTTASLAGTAGPGGFASKHALLVGDLQIALTRHGFLEQQ